RTSRRVMPAEWMPHEATWIAWPHHEPDWPGKMGAIPWTFAEIVRALHVHERVEILCHDETVRAAAAMALSAHDVSPDGYRLHVVPNDRVWLRDSAPTFVWSEENGIELMNWRFNAWAKYDNYSRDEKVGEAIQRITGIPRVTAGRPDNGEWFVLEGGGIETDGEGSLLVTEEWLLSDVQVRNPGMTRSDYEAAFAEYLGITNTIWLGNGACGDDTHGHIDDIARFSAAGVVLLAFEENTADPNHLPSVDNLRRLEVAGKRHPMRIVKLPYPRPVMMEGQRLPASYANFYIANGVVIVPTFNDPMDRVALQIIEREFPGRQVVGIHAVDLVWGLGTLHCLTQQQPVPPGMILASPVAA
ncbi:MAG TPA: agmatine deiminase family protein, partial [Gemmatimonadaceae bacterium]|nr:agmatine deiminase family protein [Gemmatimonadaceae bacterium]